MAKQDRYIFSIDAGKAGTGYAVWREGTFAKRDPAYPIENGVIFKKDVELQLKIFKTIVQRYSPIQAYIEDAAYMPQSKAGSVCASSGSLVIFAKYIGRLEQIFADAYCKVNMVSVAKWKGTLSKEIVKERIIRRLPKINCRSHDWDAVGIGLYIQGHINTKKKPYDEFKFKR